MFAPFAVGAAFARALPLCALLTTPLSAKADWAVTPAQALTGQANRAILTDAARVRWSTPNGNLWAQGEVRPTAPSVEAEGGVYRGAMSLGTRHKLITASSFSLAFVPQLRVESSSVTGSSATSPALGASLVQEATWALPSGIRISANMGIGDSVGVSAPLEGSNWANARLAVRARAAVAGIIGTVAAAPLHAEFQVTATRAVISDRGAVQSSRCELRMELSRPEIPPLRFVTSCPGDNGARFTVGIGGHF